MLLYDAKLHARSFYTHRAGQLAQRGPCSGHSSTVHGSTRTFHLPSCMHATHMRLAVLRPCRGAAGTTCPSWIQVAENGAIDVAVVAQELMHNTGL